MKAHAAKTKKQHRSFWMTVEEFENPKFHALVSLLGVTAVGIQLFLVIRMSYLVGELATLA
jgi:hypothetical protein